MHLQYIPVLLVIGVISYLPRADCNSCIDEVHTSFKDSKQAITNRERSAKEYLYLLYEDYYASVQDSRGWDLNLANNPNAKTCVGQKQNDYVEKLSKTSKQWIKCVINATSNSLETLRKNEKVFNKLAVNGTCTPQILLKNIEENDYTVQDHAQQTWYCMTLCQEDFSYLNKFSYGENLRVCLTIKGVK